MDRLHSTLITPIELARSRQSDGLRRLIAGRPHCHRFQIDPLTSVVKFTVSFLGLFTVEGTFSGLAGTIEHQASNGGPSNVGAEVPLSSVKSGIGLRDRHLRSRDYLDVERFPSAVFESSAVEWQQERFLVHGRLTVRGSTRAIVAHMAYPAPLGEGVPEDAPLDLHGHFSLNRRQFGVLGTGERKRRFDPRDLTIGNMVDITIHVRALPVR